MSPLTTTHGPESLRLPSGAQLVFERIDSTVLAGNALGDPTERPLITYLPPGYDDGDRDYPVTYCLSGFTGTGRAFLSSSVWNEGLHERLDRLLASGAIEPMIVVMPDCASVLGGSQFVNSTAVGRYEDYVIEELVPHVDATFRTRRRAGGRALVGKSSGGYGSLMLGMRHPDLFGVVACHSGDMYFEYCYKADLPKLVNALHRHGSVSAFVDQFRQQVKKRGEDIGVMNIIAMAACYSPDDSADMGIGLPLHETGALDEDVWRRWLEFDPVHVAERHVDALRGMRLLFIDCGTRDEFHLHIGARELSRRLRDLDVEHVHEEFDDGHMSITYRFDRSLPLISQAFD